MSKSHFIKVRLRPHQNSHDFKGLVPNKMLCYTMSGYVTSWLSGYSMLNYLPSFSGLTNSEFCVQNASLYSTSTEC